MAERVEVLQSRPDTPVVVLSSVHQHSDRVVGNTHDKEEENEDDAIDHVDAGFSQTKLKINKGDAKIIHLIIIRYGTRILIV